MPAATSAPRRTDVLSFSLFGRVFGGCSGRTPLVHSEATVLATTCSLTSGNSDVLPFSLSGGSSEGTALSAWSTTRLPRCPSFPLPCYRLLRQSNAHWRWLRVKRAGARRHRGAVPLASHKSQIVRKISAALNLVRGCNRHPTFEGRRHASSEASRGPTFSKGRRSDRSLFCDSLQGPTCEGRWHSQGPTLEGTMTGTPYRVRLSSQNPLRNRRGCG